MGEGARLLVVDDDDTFRGVIVRELGRRGFAVRGEATGAGAVAAVARETPAVVLLDLRLPDMDGLAVLQAIRAQGIDTEVVMLTGHGTIDTAIEAIRQGAFDYVAKPCPMDELEVRIGRALERKSLRDRARLLERGLTPADPGGAFIGRSEPFVRLMRLIDRVAPTSSTALILGETGVGKERVARLVHARSPRRDRPFVVVECAALQEDLLQSELFGHERGAFTGADRAKPGLFEVASGGTVFLDEIGEVSLATQVKLLRVMDTATFRHVGGTTELKVDVRVIAATHRDLASLVRQGHFREDLFYRLSTVTLQVPSLRDRREDIEVLVDHFLGLFNQRFGVRRRLGPKALDLLVRHPWPGNVRELLHSIESATIVCEGPEILPEHLPPAVRGIGPAAAQDDPGDGALPTLSELERRHVERVLRATGGHRGHAARTLGISERNLYRKLREYGLA